MLGKQGTQMASVKHLGVLSFELCPAKASVTQQRSNPSTERNSDSSQLPLPNTPQNPTVVGFKEAFKDHLLPTPCHGNNFQWGCPGPHPRWP